MTEHRIIDALVSSVILALARSFSRVAKESEISVSQLSSSLGRYIEGTNLNPEKITARCSAYARVIACRRLLPDGAQRVTLATGEFATYLGAGTIAEELHGTHERSSAAPNQRILNDYLDASFTITLLPYTRQNQHIQPSLKRFSLMKLEIGLLGQDQEGEWLGVLLAAKLM